MLKYQKQTIQSNKKDSLAGHCYRHPEEAASNLITAREGEEDRRVRLYNSCETTPGSRDEREMAWLMHDLFKAFNEILFSKK